MRRGEWEEMRAGRLTRQSMWGLGVRTLTFTLNEMEGPEQRRDMI